MQVNKTIKTKDGVVTFSGTLTPEEADFVFEVGLNYLVAQGAIPFKAHSDASVVVPVEGTEQ